MLKAAEWREPVLVHSIQPCGPIPTAQDEEGIYPYASFFETSTRPNLRRLRMISIENPWIKVTVCPDLGGKIHSMIDRTTGKEVLFQSGSVRPARILPRMAFISGGIEVSFPIAHTPVQIEAVHASYQQIDDRIYLWCGEKEVRYGMQWTVEYSLGMHDRFLTQRTLFYNPTSEAHPWMSWSNAALPGRADSQFYFPAGKVLRHADVLEEIDWNKSREYKLADFDRMQGFFWRTADCNAFGMFTPSLGCGLYHIAGDSEVPGIKLWLYGIGRHEAWAHLTSAQKESYVEIQAGPLLEQSEKRSLAPGGRHLHTEFWFPVSEPLDIRRMELPHPNLAGQERMPLFSWADRASTQTWLRLDEAYRNSSIVQIPVPPDIEACNWPPSGMEVLGDALKWAAAHSDRQEYAVWTYYYGVWLAGRGHVDEALKALNLSDHDGAFALKGRLLRRVKKDDNASIESFRRIASAAWKLQPQVFIERDITLSCLGPSVFPEREAWFQQVDAIQDDGILERKAAFLSDMGKFTEAKSLLESASFGKVHQRYTRSALWNRIVEGLGGNQTEIPDHLGEDDLAVYGAYRVHNDKYGNC